LWKEASTELLRQEYQRGMIAILQRRAADAAELREEYDATPEARGGFSLAARRAGDFVARS
jgi:hypothetical protein